MEDVHKCMQILKSGEKRFHSNGRLWDVLCELASAGDFPLPQQSPPSNNKRERDADSPFSMTASSSSSPGVADAPRAMAGSRRVESKVPSATKPTTTKPQSNVPSTFSLPMHSDELARLPLHGQVQFSNQNNPTLGTDSFWFSASENTATSLQAQSHPNAVSSAPAMDPVSSEAFPMDHLFYEQISNNLANQPQVTTQGQYGTSSQQFDALTSNLQQFQNQAWMDSDTIAMWSNAPTGFQLDDWGTYMNELSREQQNHAEQAVRY